MTLLVRDEEDCIASNIEYHLRQGVDFVIATDNLSTDRTASILRHYEDLGVLLYLHESADDFSQGDWVTRMARLACTRYHASWVLNSDADEFWWPAAGTLKKFFRSLPAGAEALSVKRTNFIPRVQTETSFFIRSMDVRQRSSVNALDQPLPPKVCHRAYPDVRVSQGNHDVLRGERPLGRLVTDKLLIFHFPARTFAQFRNKIEKGGSAYAANSQLHPEVGQTWRHLYGKLQQGLLEREFTLLPEEVVAQRLSTGELIRDRRLRNFFEAKIDRSVLPR